MVWHGFIFAGIQRRCFTSVVASLALLICALIRGTRVYHLFASLVFIVSAIMRRHVQDMTAPTITRYRSLLCIGLSVVGKRWGRWYSTSRRLDDQNGIYGFYVAH